MLDYHYQYSIISLLLLFEKEKYFISVILTGKILLCAYFKKSIQNRKSLFRKFATQYFDQWQKKTLYILLLFEILRPKTNLNLYVSICFLSIKYSYSRSSDIIINKNSLFSSNLFQSVSLTASQ